MALELLWGKDKYLQKELWIQTEGREIILETQILEGYSIIYVCFFSIGTMYIHASYPITLALCILNRGSFVPNSKAQKKQSLIKSHWDQYSQLVQGLMPFHNTPYRKQPEIHSWLISTAGALWQCGVGTGQAWRKFFSRWLKLVPQDPDSICISHSWKQHYLTNFL